MRSLPQILFLILTAVALVSSIGCSSPTHDEPSNTGFVESPENLKLGIDTYDKTCLNCHGPVDVSEKRGSNSTEISAALADVNEMGFIELSQLEIQAIAYALNYEGSFPNPTPPPAKKALVKVNPVISNRTQLAFKLVDIFVTDFAAPAELPVIQALFFNIFSRAEAFGGPCRIYDQDCNFNVQITAAVKVSPQISDLRKGYTTKNCDEILAVNVSVTNALARAGLTVSSAADSNNVRALANLFLPGLTLNSSIVNQLVEIHTEAEQNSLPEIDRWRFVLLPLCQTTQMELL